MIQLSNVQQQQYAESSHLVLVCLELRNRILLRLHREVSNLIKCYFTRLSQDAGEATGDDETEETNNSQSEARSHVQCNEIAKHVVVQLTLFIFCVNWETIGSLNRTQSYTSYHYRDKHDAKPREYPEVLVLWRLETTRQN
ncbi:Hypothetical_protein [Hexamita inflata]|uniref:Hypothetical_protein n=1 Tax=Hexamita inflata TaxID=28002 RepID=A0AA86RGS4_9EUKA|nr:Hypothetical protein HINF_LOCUS54475 [Hexamita inflata]